MYYDYVCFEDEILEEHKHGMLESPEFLCPECGQKMKKAILNTKFILRGQGWATKGSATANPVRKVREHKIGIKKGYEDSVTPEQVEKDFGGKIHKKIDKRKNK